MVRFYFFDTNLILGYCNFLDRIHLIAKDVLEVINLSWSRNVILLFSVEKEFNLKIQKEIDNFEKKLEEFFENDIHNIEDIKNNWGKINNFERFIFDLFNEEKLKDIDYSDFFHISLKYYKKLINTFDILTKQWIKRPHVEDYKFVKNTRNYTRYFKRISKLTHYPDNEHLTFAIYESLNNAEHEYIFYTMDNKWVGIDITLGVPNFRILIPLVRIMFIGRKSIFEYSASILNHLNEGYSCLITARGNFINKAVDTTLYLQNNICLTLKIDKILIDTDIIDERKISVIKIYISN